MKQHEGSFKTDLSILSHDHMTRVTREQAHPSPNFLTTRAGGRLTPYVRFIVQQARYTADFQWNQVSSLELSGSEADTFPLDHRGLEVFLGVAVID
ncbi:hypothetical protein AVEN_180391-1 [Araneus ventricosus]|uniref:Uncharacterized protein n=1 Tax=Araneus ventricosus TaxID=182803 RepID=A0A4Y2MJ09_ARAVE|nr:hypothetical protein AVEN_180391-1 [Araneus ventricosus]